MFNNGYNSFQNVVYVNQSSNHKFQIMECVVIQSDILNLGLPIGKLGYVTSLFDHKGQSAFDYMIRVPSEKEFYAVNERDLVDFDDYVLPTVERVLNDSLINHALDTGDADLFKEVAKKRIEST